MHIDITELSNKAPFALIQNLYTQEEVQEIICELDYLHTRKSLWVGPDKSGSAKDAETEETLKKNKCIWLNHVYKNNDASAILTSNIKLYSSGAAKELADSHYMFEYLIHNSQFSTLLSYYENSDSYKAHRDQSVLTTLTWFYKEPKVFEGGNLILNSEATVECLNSLMVIIPSTVLHEVTLIILPPEHRDQGLGRYTVTTFVTVKASQE